MITGFSNWIVDEKGDLKYSYFLQEANKVRQLLIEELMKLDKEILGDEWEPYTP